MGKARMTARDKATLQKTGREFGQRESQARENMLESIMNLGEMPREDAEKVFDYYKKHKLFNMRDAAVTGSIAVKHGAFIDKDVLRRALTME